MAAPAPNVVPKGGLLFGILVDGRTGHQSIADRRDLDSWVTANKTPDTWTLDADPSVKQYFGRIYDSFIIVDLRTMKILRASSNDGIAALNAFLALL